MWDIDGQVPTLAAEGVGTLVASPNLPLAHGQGRDGEEKGHP